MSNTVLPEAKTEALLEGRHTQGQKNRIEELIVTDVADTQQHQGTYYAAKPSEYNLLEFEYRTEMSLGLRIYEWLKRGFDILIAAIALVVISPFLIVVGLMIVLYDGGPIFFSQTRIGQFGRLFRCYKLHTMLPHADQMKSTLQEMNDHGESITFKMRSDPRITPLGRFLRKASLDEVPQLFNVLLGDMSLVGPRPAVPGEVMQYSDRHRHRLLVKPGLTCVWQVSGRGDIPFDKQVEMDLDYIHRRNLLLDIRLVLKTIPAVVSMRGAY